MLRIEMLPASHGDGLWIEYGDTNAPRRVLIDGGVPGDAPRLVARAAAAGGACRLELLVISHLDADHIGAPLAFLQKLPAQVEIGDVWFHGRKHLPSDFLSFKHADEVSALLTARGLPWNEAFGGGAVMIPAEGALPVKELAGGATLTLLSPGRPQLATLARRWDEEVARGGGPAMLGVGEAAPRTSKARSASGPIDVGALAALPFEADATAPNGSSIAFLFEYAGQRVLFGADAHAPVLERSLARLPGETPLALDAFKVPHHGSAKNLSAGLLAAVDCRRFLVSTNGRQFHHPDREAIARIVHGVKGATVYFNYRTPRNEGWGDEALRAAHGYEVVYPAAGAEGLVLELTTLETPQGR
jgi:beta-lactamase superfamily II metal-dependent hydrolase